MLLIGTGTNRSRNERLSAGVNVGDSDAGTVAQFHPDFISINLYFGCVLIYLCTDLLLWSECCLFDGMPSSCSQKDLVAVI